MIKKIWRDMAIIIVSIWINLVLFLILIIFCTVMLKFFGANQQEGWLQLFLDSFHLATIESVETGGKAIPILLAFIMPIGMAVILGEGVLRVFSIYMQRRVNRKEWDLMVVKTFENHTLVCGVGEMGRQLIKRMKASQPGNQIVLIDQRPGLLAEIGLTDDDAIQFQGNMADVEILGQTNLRSAKLVILTAGDDAINLEAAYKIHQIKSFHPDMGTLAPQRVGRFTGSITKTTNTFLLPLPAGC